MKVNAQYVYFNQKTETKKTIEKELILKKQMHVKKAVNIDRTSKFQQLLLYFLQDGYPQTLLQVFVYGPWVRTLYL